VGSLFIVEIPEFSSSARARHDSVHGWREFVEVGGLMSYVPNLDDLHRRAATYGDKNLKEPSRATSW
jgi:hypothetical protein